jgi:hypothetical protein
MVATDIINCIGDALRRAREVASQKFAYLQL